jgi:ribosomal protein S19
MRYNVCMSRRRGERASSSTKDEKQSRILERRWISVKEQLPARDLLILIYDTELMVGVAVAVFNGKDFFSVSGDKLFIYKNVTHWMRLPSRPAMVSN